MRTFRSTLRLLPILLIAITMIGCDSGGDGGSGNELGDTVTIVVEGNSDASVSWSATLYYQTSDGFCIASGTNYAGSGSPRVEQTIEPESFGDCPPEGTEPSDFSGVRATASVLSGPEDITVQLLSDGNQLDEASDPEDSGNFQGFWVVEAGEIPSLDDLSGN